MFRPQNLILTAAIGASAATIDTAYDIPEMYKYLDYVHVMCYDYHGKTRLVNDDVTNCEVVGDCSRPVGGRAWAALSLTRGATVLVSL